MSHYKPDLLARSFLWMTTASLFLFGTPIAADGDSNSSNPLDGRLSQLVIELKADSLGPFDGVYWFCNDGSIHPGNEPCDSIGGVRHGLKKDIVDEIGRHHGIFIGQILTGIQFETFLDQDKLFSRAKQYQLEKYLCSVDDGWIMRTARFTPGLIDSTDEAMWGREFLSWLCEDDERIFEQYFVIRQFARDIPHKQATGYQTGIDSLVEPYPAGLAPYLARTPEGTIIWNKLNTLITANDTADASSVLIADLLFDIRKNILSVDSEWRLDALDLSLDLEKMLIRHAIDWRPDAVNEALRKNNALARALAGCGYIGLWEWDKIAPFLIVDDDVSNRRTLSIETYAAAARRVFRWGTSMIAVHYQPIENLYSGFEPLVSGFTGYRTRSTLLDAMGNAVGETQSYLASMTGLDNEVFADSIQSHFRGMSPGAIAGVLRVASKSDTIDTFSTDTIYALPRVRDTGSALALVIPADSARAGSLVWPRLPASELPVSSISPNAFGVLDSMNGTLMFYAVSPQGRVILKPAEDATEDEALITGIFEPNIDDDVVQTGRIDLEETRCLPITSIPGLNRGLVCGARAAAVGELSIRFPDAVPPAFVIPFGVFREHLEQKLPGSERTYWDFIDETYEKANEWREDGELERVIDHIVMLRFAQLREMLQSMPLLSEFRNDLTRTFALVFNNPLGTVPINLYVHSNATDLETVMSFKNPVHYNLTSESAIQEAILDAWTSVFSDASYDARQCHVNDPADIYASILIQRAINFEKSGTMLTTGLVNNEPEDITVMIGWGVGGNNNYRETYLLKADGADVLLSPARQLEYSILSAAGDLGVGYESKMMEMTGTTGRLALRHLAAVVRSEVRKFTGGGTYSPVALDMGFEGGNVWLLGIRPLTTDRRSAREAYLSSLDSDSWIDLEVRPDSPFSGTRIGVDSVSTGAER